MNTFRCPHCGSPVMIRGNWWECGWCGDSGYLASSKSAKQNDLPTIRDEELEELERGVLSVVEGMQKHFGDGQAERTKALQLAIYGMSHALCPSGNQTPHSLALLQAFFSAIFFLYRIGSVGSSSQRNPCFCRSVCAGAGTARLVLAICTHRVAFVSLWSCVAGLARANTGRFEPDRKLLFRTGRIGRTCFSATDLERPLECQTNTI